MHPLLSRIHDTYRSIRALLGAACLQAADSFRHTVLPSKSGPGTLLGSLLHFYVALTGLLGSWSYPWTWTFVSRLPQHARWRSLARRSLLLLGWLLFLASSLEWTPAAAAQQVTRLQAQELRLGTVRHEPQSPVPVCRKTAPPRLLPTQRLNRSGMPAVPCTLFRRYLSQRRLRI